MSLVLYYAPMTSAIRAQWALEELEVRYEKRKLDLAAGEHKRPEFLALNPNGKVPLLVVHGTPIFEGVAIAIYLGETYGVSKGLYPPPGLNRAEVLKWIAWSAASLGEALSRFARNTQASIPAEARNEHVAAAARRDLQELADILEKALEKREYLVGGAFSFADLMVAPMLAHAAQLGIDLEPFIQVKAWSARCLGRPALARAMKD
ncbi:glutathione S-transferase family protein [Chondromyces apiculatus]|uniref:Glutathione S-transferase n=1 Tax=Chondromyces apiculatus DSM 436 TaxID=1192034 RepID=A0A017TFR3_9BACT|nr:glutathione S-transferase family protein [Chondromyces apiculatus]EYF08118.1 Glutathione S-transferase [Chondromyces apiculatus DSM 436]